LGQKTMDAGRSTYAPALPGRHYASTNEGTGGEEVTSGLCSRTGEDHYASAPPCSP
jgi:hypothetical protein